MNKTQVLVLFALLSLLHKAQASPVLERSESERVELLLPQSFAGRPIQKISLQEALQRSIAENLNIQLRRETWKQSQFSLQASRASFEPTLGASLQHSDSLSPPANSVDGKLGQVFQANSQQWSLRLSKRFTTGTQLSLNVFSSRNQNNSGSALNALVYGGNTSVSLTQPLLRGFSLDRDIQRASVLQATFANQKEWQNQRIAVAAQVLSTENAYWDLVRAQRAFAL